MSRLLALIAIVALALSLVNCGSGGSQNGTGPGGGGGVFSPTNSGGSGNTFMDLVKRITRWETSEVGGGIARSNGLVVQRVSIGGSYLHRPTADNSLQLNPGVHGNPRATQ